MTDNAIEHKQDYSEKDIAYFDNPRLSILPLLPKKMDNILEIGAGAGGTLAHIKTQYKGVSTFAVEPFAEAASIARTRVDVVLEDTLENLTPKDFADTTFDVILCLDVLEHLQDPWEGVKKLAMLLSPGGRIIASIPNVSHYSCLFPLLFKNEWRLRNEGVLDRTHLRFFVKKTAIELMTCSGLETIDVCSNLKWRTGTVSLLNKMSFGLFERFLTTQYYVTVT